MTLPEVVVALAPRILTDECEPFSLNCMTYRLVSGDEECAGMPPKDVCVEFQLGWSGDIGHLVDSEWLRVSAAYESGSWRSFQVTTRPHGLQRTFSLAVDRVELLAEPGKHGLVREGDLSLPKDVLSWMCEGGAGWDGVFPFGPRTGGWGVADDRRARRSLRRSAFSPTWNFSRSTDVSDLPCVPWEDFDDAILSQAAVVLEGVDASPAQLEVGDWGSGAPFIFAGPAAYTTKWTCGGTDLSRCLSRARSERGQLLLPISSKDAAFLPALWKETWNAYSSSLVLVVGLPSVAASASHLGFHAAALLSGPSPDWRGNWAAVDSPDLALDLGNRYQTVGPGATDIVLDAPLERLVRS